MLGDELLRADRHVDGKRRVDFRKQFAVSRVVGGADARNARGVLVEQRAHHLTRHHVHFVAVRQCDQDVGVARTGCFEDAGIRRAAGDGANVDAVLQIAQQLIVHVDDRDFVGLFARQMMRGGASYLPGAEDDDSHGASLESR